MALHAYTGAAAVLMTCGPLLAPLPSKLSCLRQRIPRLSRGPWLLRQSSRQPACGGRLLPSRPLGRARCRFPRSGRPFCVALGPCSPPGLAGVDAGLYPVCQPHIRPHFGQAANPRRLVWANDGSSHIRSRCPWLPAPRCAPVGFGPDLVLSPLCGLRVSRYRRGYTFRCPPLRLGIAPNVGHPVVRVGSSFLLPPPPILECPHSFRENESHRIKPILRRVFVIPGTCARQGEKDSVKFQAGCLGTRQAGANLIIPPAPRILVILITLGIFPLALTPPHA